MKRFVSTLIVLGFVFSLSACGLFPSSEDPTTSVAQTTLKQTTSTIATTTETKAPAILTAEEVLAELKDAGLPISNIVVYDEKTDPNKTLGRPGSYASKANFSDPAHEDSDIDNPDNTIEVFVSEEDAKTRAEYVKSVTEGTFMAQYIYQVGVYVLRLDYDVLPSDAEKYEEALIVAVR